jgi:hypothetical protein
MSSLAFPFDLKTLIRVTRETGVYGLPDPSLGQDREVGGWEFKSVTPKFKGFTAVIFNDQ